MGYQAGKGNEIDASAQLAENVIIGNYNYIGKNVVISGFKGTSKAKIIIGDCNNIYDNTRIMVGGEGLSVGDWNVFHNNMLIMGSQRMEIGHNCWFGQNTILDSAGGLFIGNGVRVGMYSQIWTHVASGELIEGCTLFSSKPTFIEDDVWLVGSCIVGLGLTLGHRAICMNGSLITKNIKSNTVYRGAPAKPINRVSFYKNVSLDEKMEKMLDWVEQFVHQSGDTISFEYSSNSKMIRVAEKVRGEYLIIGFDQSEIQPNELATYFNLTNKTYTKRLTDLERNFYRFIYDHKARFLPVKDV